MTRREMIKSTLAAGVGGGLVAGAAASPQGNQGKFKLHYAPHFGMFGNHAGGDPVDQLKWAADQGFTAWEDNGMMDNSPAMQEKIGKAMADLGMTMGVFVSHAEWQKPLYALGGDDTRKMLVARMKEAIEVAKRVNAKWTTVVPGPYDLRLAWDFQTANVVEMLRAMAEVCEPAGLVMVLEPLNPYRDHPGMFLSKIPQAFLICRAVNSPSCKILFDMYHQQITEGNIIPNLDRAYSEVAYIQTGDNPGRREPTTGEMNYQNIFRHLKAKGWTGVIGMEHGNSKSGKEGELAVINAYRFCDQ